MLVYHFLNLHYGIEALKEHRLKISKINALNDPFEYLHFQTGHHFAKIILKTRKKNASEKWGVLCFSASYENPVQWAHYAESNRGLCLGFNIPDEMLITVDYVRERATLEEFRAALTYKDQDFLRHMLSKKFDHWSYEQESRVLCKLASNQIVDDLCFSSFSPELELNEVVVGFRSLGAMKQIKKILNSYAGKVEVYAAAPSSSEFRIIKHGQE